MSRKGGADGFSPHPGDPWHPEWSPEQDEVDADLFIEEAEAFEDPEGRGGLFGRLRRRRGAPDGEPAFDPTDLGEPPPALDPTLVADSQPVDSSVESIYDALREPVEEPSGSSPPAEAAVVDVPDLDAEELAAQRLAAAEAARLEAERLEAEAAALLEVERRAAQERARLEAERLASEERARLETEAAALLEAERLEAERLEAERLEAERLEAERLEAERLEAERLEAERLEAERLEAERLEAERLEAERLEAERLEAERLEAERLEAERLEAERLEAERLEAERLEAERLDADERARLEVERLEAEAAREDVELFVNEEAIRLAAEHTAAEEAEFAAVAEAAPAGTRESAEVVGINADEAVRAIIEFAESETAEAANKAAVAEDGELALASDAIRVELERRAAEEAAREEAERLAAEEAARAEAERRAAERKARIEAQRRAAVEAERRAARQAEQRLSNAELMARRALQEAPHLEAERIAARAAADASLAVEDAEAVATAIGTPSSEPQDEQPQLFAGEPAIAGTSRSPAEPETGSEEAELPDEAVTAAMADAAASEELAEVVEVAAEPASEELAYPADDADIADVTEIMDVADQADPAEEAELQAGGAAAEVVRLAEAPALEAPPALEPDEDTAAEPDAAALSAYAGLAALAGEPDLEVDLTIEESAGDLVFAEGEPHDRPVAEVDLRIEEQAGETVFTEDDSEVEDWTAYVEGHDADAAPHLAGAAAPGGGFLSRFFRRRRRKEADEAAAQTAPTLVADAPEVTAEVEPERVPEVDIEAGDHTEEVVEVVDGELPGAGPPEGPGDDERADVQSPASLFDTPVDDEDGENALESPEPVAAVPSQDEMFADDGHDYEELLDLGFGEQTDVDEAEGEWTWDESTGEASATPDVAQELSEVEAEVAGDLAAEETGLVGEQFESEGDEAIPADSDLVDGVVPEAEEYAEGDAADAAAALAAADTEAGELAEEDAWEDFTAERYVRASTTEHANLAEAIAQAAAEDTEQIALSASMPGVESGLVGLEDVVAASGEDVGDIAPRQKSDLPIRVATALLLVSAFFASLLWQPAVGALVIVIIGIAAAEFYTVLTNSGRNPMTLLGVAGVVGAMLATWAWGPISIPATVAVTLVALLVYYGIVTGRRNPLQNLALTVLGVAWIGGFGALVFELISAEEYQWLMLGLVLTVALTDIAQFFGGRSLGRHQLAPVVSPKKTVEGLVAGIVVAVAAGAALAVTDTFSLQQGLITGGIVAVFAPIGDLAVSVVKRAIGVKDMGVVLPGHGGVFDRIDAMLFTVPALWVAWSWMGLLT